MNCRKFERLLEDYLQGGLDFAGRFQMERHARQCIRCGREMAGALRLKEMAREIGRVRAPSDFEVAVMEEIGKRKSRNGPSSILRFWVYGVERPSIRKLALAALSLAVIGAGTFSFYRFASPMKAPAPALVSGNPAEVRPDANAAAGSTAAVPKPRPVVEIAGLADVKEPAGSEERMIRRSFAPETEFSETEYVEHVVAGPGDIPVTVRLPRKIRMQYGQTSEEYFIRNVSH